MHGAQKRAGSLASRIEVVARVAEKCVLGVVIGFTVEVIRAALAGELHLRSREIERLRSATRKNNAPNYVAREATPERMPTARSTRSASARINSGESLSAGIRWKSLIPAERACSRASMSISCKVST